MLSSKVRVNFQWTGSILLLFLLLFLVSAQIKPGMASTAKVKTPAKTYKKSPKLVAGGIHAELPLQKSGKNYSRGSFAITEIKLFNRSRKRYLSGELEFETEGADIRSISNLANSSGRNFRIVKKDGKYVARIRRLRKKRPQILWIELKLSEEQGAPQTPRESRLKITLRSKTGKKQLSDSTKISWSIANCASAYHRALTKIGGERIPAIQDAMKATSHYDRSLPGRWIFKPRRRYQKQIYYKSVCRKYKRRWNKKAGKWKSTCRAYKKVRRTAYKEIGSTKALRPYYKAASTFVFARGADPAFRKKSGNRWVTTKIARDLKRYLTQNSNPAICTGAPQMTEYYDRKFSQIAKRAAWIHKMSVDSRKMAAAKTAEFITYLKSRRLQTEQAEDEPKAQPVSLETDDEKAELPDKPLIEQIRKIVAASDDDSLTAEFSEVKDVLQALKLFKDKQEQYKELLSLDDKAAAQMYALLSLIESARYLEISNLRYNGLKQSIQGSLVSIRQAHDKHCNCSL